MIECSVKECKKGAEFIQKIRFKNKVKWTLDLCIYHRRQIRGSHYKGQYASQAEERKSIINPVGNANND